jgi:chemotaxis protein CheX
MDVKYINPFLAATKDIFATMIDLPLKLNKPCINKTRTPDFGICCIIGLAGTVKGCVVISVGENLAIQLASALVQEPLDAFNEDAVDAIGEIANMVVGNAKSSFPEAECSISVPSVVIGQHKVSFPSTVPIITIPCEIGTEHMNIDIAIVQR